MIMEFPYPEVILRYDKIIWRSKFVAFSQNFIRLVLMVPSYWFDGVHA